MAKIVLHRSSAIDFHCPHCGQALKVERDMQGAVVDCPACSVEITCPRGRPSVAAAQEPAQPRKPNLAKGEFRCENCDFVGMPVRKPKGNIPMLIFMSCLGVLPGLAYLIMRSGYRFICPKCTYNYKTDVVR